MMLTLPLSIAIFVLALLMLRHAYLRWRHEYLDHRLPQPDPSAEPFLGHAMRSTLRSWSIANVHQTMDVTWEPEPAGLTVAGWGDLDEHRGGV